MLISQRLHLLFHFKLFLWPASSFYSFKLQYYSIGILRSFTRKMADGMTESRRNNSGGVGVSGLTTASFLLEH